MTDLIIPDNQGVGAFECPECGNEIRSPYAGHTWTCHETYGGCGASFEPVRAFKRVE